MYVEAYEFLEVDLVQVCCTYHMVGFSVFQKINIKALM